MTTDEQMGDTLETTSSLSHQPSTNAQFTNVPLGTGEKRKKQPRRLIHFSDGVLEEYSTDEEEETPQLPPPVDPKTLSWGPWMWYYFAHAGWNTLAAADFCGEKLAWFFGITTPKYQSAIDEFYRLKKEEERESEMEDKAREKFAELSSIDVKVIESKDTHQASCDQPVEKY